MNRWFRSSCVLGVVLSVTAVSLPVLTVAQAPTAPAPPGAALVTAQKTLPWAFPLAAPGQTRHDDGKVQTLPGAARGFTVPEINDPFAPPDWYPNEHPPAPPIVATGRRPAVRACGQCHMLHGLGHPESSSLAGLPASYIRQQMEDFKTNARKNSPLMSGMANAMTDQELEESANYYASIPMKKWTRIEEAATVPKTFVGPGNMRFIDTKQTGTEPIAGRIIELPEDAEHAELRDPHSSFMAYVPPGSIKRGQQLVETGGNGKTVRCTLCHGADLKGMGPVPGLRGRSPIYVVRQLYGFQHGLREGLWSDLMKEAVAKLTVDDLVAIAAYTASREP
jgi:cytochrome c553